MTRVQDRLPPPREVTANEMVNALIETLSQHRVPYLVGKTWTTDAPYRETANQIVRRKEEVCLRCLGVELIKFLFKVCILRVG